MISFRPLYIFGPLMIMKIKKWTLQMSRPRWSAMRSRTWMEKDEEEERSTLTTPSSTTCSREMDLTRDLSLLYIPRPVYSVIYNLLHTHINFSNILRCYRVQIVHFELRTLRSNLSASSRTLCTLSPEITNMHILFLKITRLSKNNKK